MVEERGVGLKGWLSGPAHKERRAKPSNTSGSIRHRLAILPLSNISPDPQDEYFADGMTEEVISTVSRIEGLEVISRTSVLQYKKTPKPVRDVSRELDVGTVLEGSVRKAGNKLRVTVQMIDAEKDRHLWTENYDRELQDVFAIQTDIAKQVAEALQVRLLPADRKVLEKSPTTNLEAYTWYLKARQSSYKDRQALELSMGYYEKAIALDPRFALAYSGLASSYSRMAFHGMLPRKEAGAKARNYAKKALSIDDSLAEAHQAMGTILRNFDWDFAGAENEFNRAIELNPSLAIAHASKALILMFKRQAKEAIAEAERALELDPISEDTIGTAATVYLYMRHYDEARELFTKALGIDPQNEFARNNLGLTLVQQGVLDEGIREIERVMPNRSTTGRIDLSYAYAKAGRIDELKKLLKDSLSEVGNNHDLALTVAAAYANLGDSDHAFEWLEKSYSDRVAALISINVDFAFDGIRDDPRFQSLTRRLGFANH